MANLERDSPWVFRKFGLIVTGKGEREFLPALFKPLSSRGDCHFEVIAKVEQRSPITSEKRKLKMTGSRQTLPSKDAEEIGLKARNYLNGNPNSFVLLVDDLEQDRRNFKQATFDRYRRALDEVLPEDLRRRTSVHFLVNMVEAYYLADASAVNEVLGTSLTDYDGDVEDHHHPKGYLESVRPGFDEIRHGSDIINRLDLDRVLSSKATCASLRTMIRWCWDACDGVPGERFQLVDGVYCPVTGSQLRARNQSSSAAERDGC